MSGLSNLWSKLARNKKYREAFVASQLKRGIPTQMRVLLKQRGWSQAELAERSGLTQGAISRAADPDYGNLTFNNVLKIAAGFDVAFVGKFIPFSELAFWHDSIDDETALTVDSFDEDIEPQSKETSVEAALAAHVAAPAPLDWHSELDPGYPSWIGEPMNQSSVARFTAMYSQPLSGHDLLASLQKWIQNGQPESDFNKMDGGLSNSLESALLGHGVSNLNAPVDIGWYRIAALKKGPEIERERIFTMSNQNEPESGPEVVSKSHDANMSTVDYSNTKHGRFYANHVAAGLTMFDIRLVLSDVDVDGERNKLVASETLTLFLAPELAFMVHAALGAAIFNYTSKFGKLRIPDGFLSGGDPVVGTSPQSPSDSSEPPA